MICMRVRLIVTERITISVSFPVHMLIANCDFLITWNFFRTFAAIRLL